MPWSDADAVHSTKKANTPTKKRLWAKTANSVLERTGDEVMAKRTANAAVAGTIRHRNPGRSRGHSAKRRTGKVRSRVGAR